jgi:hypothetical protein
MSATQPDYEGARTGRSHGPLYVIFGIVLALILAGSVTAVMLVSTGKAEPKEPDGPKPACGLAKTASGCTPPPKPPTPPIPPVQPTQPTQPTPPPVPPGANLDPTQACMMLAEQDPTLVEVGRETVDGYEWIDYDADGDGMADVSASPDGQSTIILVAQDGSWEDAVGGTCERGMFTPLDV